MLRLAAAALLASIVGCDGFGGSGGCSATAKVPLVEISLPPVAGGSAYDGIFEVDPATDSLIQKHALRSGCAPAGLAINAARRQALLGCSGQLVVFWDLAQHRLVKVDRAAGAGDLATYSAVADLYLFAADA